MLQAAAKGPLDDEDEIPMLPPLYITEFVLEPLQLTFTPDEEEFHDGHGEVMKGFQDTVLRVQNLVPDTYFDAFTRSLGHFMLFTSRG